jgi:hypothetical protein
MDSSDSTDLPLKEYDRVIIAVFEKLHKGNEGADSLHFTKEDVVQAIAELGLVINNVPDIPYTYRTGRSPLPDAILAHGQWAIDGAGKGKYYFVKLTRSPYIDIPDDIEITPILDATPLIVLRYQSSDEQALLARLRYNRLIDIFTSLTTYHLQGHFRTTVNNVGQVEIDDLFIGVDTDGQGYLLPLEAKSSGPKDQLGVVQITQMVKFAREHFPEMPVRPIGVKVLPDESYIFVEFTDTQDSNEVASRRYKRYRLVRESV